MWTVEIKECGVWDTFLEAESLFEALSLASTLTSSYREEWIRIVTPELKII